MLVVPAHPSSPTGSARGRRAGVGALVDDELTMREHVAAVGHGQRDGDVLLDEQHRAATSLA